MTKLRDRRSCFAISNASFMSKFSHRCIENCDAAACLQEKLRNLKQTLFEQRIKHGAQSSETDQLDRKDRQRTRSRASSLSDTKGTRAKQDASALVIQKAYRQRLVYKISSASELLKFRHSSVRARLQEHMGRKCVIYYFNPEDLTDPFMKRGYTPPSGACPVGIDLLCLLGYALILQESCEAGECSFPLVHKLLDVDLLCP